jgi:hypothetical protein
VSVIVPRAEIADVAAVAAHYDELDELYRSLWGTNLHHAYWITCASAYLPQSNERSRRTSRQFGYFSP